MIGLPRRSREVFSAVVAALEAGGIHNWSLDASRKHPCVRWLGPDGRVRQVSFGRTPSCHRAALNVAADVRRMIAASI